MKKGVGLLLTKLLCIMVVSILIVNSIGLSTKTVFASSTNNENTVTNELEEAALNFTQVWLDGMSLNLTPGNPIPIFNSDDVLTGFDIPLYETESFILIFKLLNR